MRAYDHEEDQESLPEHPQPQKQESEEDYHLPALASQLREALTQLRAHDSALRRLQRDVDGRVPEAQLTEAIALINAGIHADPNVVKLLKSREAEAADEAEGKVRANAAHLSRKLNQMAEALTMLLAGQKRLQTRVAAVEGDLGRQLAEKTNSLQLQLEQVRGEASRADMELTQRLQLAAFELGDRVREVESKVSWRLNEFKGKLEEKISQELVLMYLEKTEKRVEKSMREFEVKSNVDPSRIDRLEAEVAANRTSASEQIARCNYLISNMQAQIQKDLVQLEHYSANRLDTEKRLCLFSQNFTDMYQRVITCEKEGASMRTDITGLLRDSNSALTELKRINTVLLNIKISDDFQRMLEEMSPSKVLELQDSVDAVKAEQNNLFRQIALAKREINVIQAKSENMGFLTPNREREKLKKEELEEALHGFLTDHHFVQKLNSLDRRLTDYNNTMDSVALLSRQVARLQKENDSHRLAFQIKHLEEYFKRELAVMAARFHERPTQEQLDSNRDNQEHFPIEEVSLRRSFSSKKMSALSLSRLATSKHHAQMNTRR